MGSKIKFIGNADVQFKDEIHFFGTINDYTLCGLTMDSDEETCGDFVPTKEKVNCNNCISIVNYSKSIKRSEFI